MSLSFHTLPWSWWWIKGKYSKVRSVSLLLISPSSFTHSHLERENSLLFTRTWYAWWRGGCVCVCFGWKGYYVSDLVDTFPPAADWRRGEASTLTNRHMYPATCKTGYRSYVERKGIDVTFYVKYDAGWRYGRTCGNLSLTCSLENK